MNLRSSYYVPDENGNPVPASMLEWAKWFETHDRHIANDTIDGVQISTVFLGLDHSWSGGKPVLWETMIFGGEHNEYQQRYTSREDALKGHEIAKRMVRGECEKEA